MHKKTLKICSWNYPETKSRQHARIPDRDARIDISSWMMWGRKRRSTPLSPMLHSAIIPMSLLLVRLSLLLSSIVVLTGCLCQDYNTRQRQWRWLCDVAKTVGMGCEIRKMEPLQQLYVVKMCCECLWTRCDSHKRKKDDHWSPHPSLGFYCLVEDE